MDTETNPEKSQETPAPTHPITALTERIHKQADAELTAFLRAQLLPIYQKIRELPSGLVKRERMEIACRGSGITIKSDCYAQSILGMAQATAEEALRQDFRDRKVAEFMRSVEALSYALENGEAQDG